MEERQRTDLTGERKRRLARGLREWWPLRLALAIVARVSAPCQPVGVVGAVFDADDRVLLVEHVFRTDFPWGLPGGWIRRGEQPREALRRELAEELGLDVEVGRLLFAEPIGLTGRSTHPRHLGLAYACRLVGGTPRLSLEVLSLEWVKPGAITREMAPFQRRAAMRALEIINADARAAGGREAL